MRGIYSIDIRKTRCLNVARSKRSTKRAPRNTLLLTCYLWIETATIHYLLRFVYRWSCSCS